MAVIAEQSCPVQLAGTLAGWMGCACLAELCERKLSGMHGNNPNGRLWQSASRQSKLGQDSLAGMTLELPTSGWGQGQAAEVWLPPKPDRTMRGQSWGLSSLEPGRTTLAKTDLGPAESGS